MKLEIPYDIIDVADLTPEDQELIEAAKSAMEHAYAPYSQFHVGCSLRKETGKLITGNNQENAAYPSGLCAERVALFAAMSEEKSPIEAIAVVAQNSQGSIVEACPCGSCRQVMLEYATNQKTPIRIFMVKSQSAVILIEDVKWLLPFHFTKELL